jgi:hypothetical protein
MTITTSSVQVDASSGGFLRLPNRLPGHPGFGRWLTEITRTEFLEIPTTSMHQLPGLAVRAGAMKTATQGLEIGRARPTRGHHGKDRTAAVVEKAYDARRVAVASKAVIFGRRIFA